MEVIETIAREKWVEEIVYSLKASRDEDSDDLKDLCQMIYLSLLEYDQEKIEQMYYRKELRFFITRMCINQVSSKNSPYYYIYKKNKKQINQKYSVGNITDEN